MGWRRYWFLAWEFFYPLTVGAYYDGQSLYLPPSLPHRPGRLYLALSHRELYFQTVRLPTNIPPERLPSALNIEASRLLGLLEGREGLQATSSFLPLEGGLYLLAFREVDFFKSLWAKVPANLIPCGVFPAWVALLAWFWVRKQGHLEDGIYMARLSQAIEGFRWRAGQIVGLLPASPTAVDTFLKDHPDPCVVLEGEEARKALVEGASLVPSLPPHYQRTFDLYPLRVRPRVPKKALLLWLLPFFLGISGLGLQRWDQALQKEEALLDEQLAALKKKESQLEAQLQEQKTFENLAQRVQTFEVRPPLLEALAELARLLPPGSWIRKLEFRAPDTIQLWGESDNVLEVIKLLEESPVFRDVKVLSSVTKNPRTGKENFAIRAHLEGIDTP